MPSAAGCAVRAVAGLRRFRRHGQDWAKAMFDHTSHDFGVVARGAKVEHRFVIENIYEEDAHIQSVRRVADAPRRSSSGNC